MGSGTHRGEGRLSQQIKDVKGKEGLSNCPRAKVTVPRLRRGEKKI